MKKLLLLLTLGLLSAGSANAISISYASVPGSSISFDGLSNFSFAPALNSFDVTSGTASGFLGQITGTFTIGNITTVGITNSAPVTGTGTFVINDGGTPFTATLNWVDILQVGTGSTLNVQGTANLTGITYTGLNPDLVALSIDGIAANTLNFTFNPKASLLSLKTTKKSTSFSGTLSNVPEGGSGLAMLGLGLIGAGVLRKKLASKA